MKKYSLHKKYLIIIISFADICIYFKFLNIILDIKLKNTALLYDKVRENLNIFLYLKKFRKFINNENYVSSRRS